MRGAVKAVLLVAFLAGATARGAVVINEIFYHAPLDMDDVQWIELYNSGEKAVDLGGWQIARGTSLTFVSGTTIAADGYVVVALQPEQFKKVYGIAAAGKFSEPLGRGKDKLDLIDAQGKRVDRVKYKDGEPWPVAADGYSASLERISPNAPGDVPENWASSPLPADAPRPAGTPGKRNSCYSKVLPPIVTVNKPLDELSPQPLAVEARVVDTTAIRKVELLYCLVANGVEAKEEALEMKLASGGLYLGTIPAQKAGTLVRYRVRATSAEGIERLCPAENDLRPTFSAYVHDKWELARIPFGLIVHGRSSQPVARPAPRRGWGGFFGRPAPEQNGDLMPRSKYGPAQTRPPRGTSAFVYVDEKTGKMSLFDHINIPPRDNGRGFKVHFHKDRTLNGISTLSVEYEGSERSLLAEHLAYEVYRRAGNAAPWSGFARISVDGRMVGYHLMIEDLNKSFLKRNGLDDQGNLYKLLWFGGDLIGQHELKTNTQHPDHRDLIQIVQKLQQTQGEAKWKVIEENFDVKQVATYFAANMVLSHWDGFFNNYFTYHDTHGTGKWTMYPWDQDKTWGYHDGLSESDFFYNMPLTFGMAGDRPPGGDFGGPFGGGGSAWWRAPGWFSGPLLAEPHFRKVFLDRTREILDKVYTKQVFFPLMDQVKEKLLEDVKLRAKLNGEREEDGVRRLERNLQVLKAHLEKRREFLLKQPELAGKGG